MAGRLVPSGRRFLPELSMIAELGVAAAGALRERLASAIGRPDHAAALAAHAREADRLAAALAIGAPHALVPPIDGEDATELASRLRDVVEATRRLGRLADAICPELPNAGVAYLADLLVQAADSLEGAAATLTDRSSALDFAHDVRRLGREGERAFVDAMECCSPPHPTLWVRCARWRCTARYGSLSTPVCARPVSSSVSRSSGSDVGLQVRYHRQRPVSL